MSDYLDEDGYPTEDALNHIKEFPVTGSAKELLDFVRSLWNWDNMAGIEERPHPFKDGEVEHIMWFSTGGWSGNEDLIRALKSNFLGQMLWVKSERGGHHEYSYEEQFA